MNFLKANRLSLLALFVMTSMTLLLFDDLPAELPYGVKWSGEVKGTLPKAIMAFLNPMVFLFTILALNVAIHFSPQKFSLPNSKRPMDIIQFGVGILLCFMQYGMLMSEGDSDFVLRYVGYGLACSLLIVGNIVGKMEHNFFVGLKLPWTIASVENWRATQRFAGRLMVVCGALLLIGNWVIPNKYLILFSGLSPVLIAVVYSFLYYLRNEKNGQSA